MKATQRTCAVCDAEFMGRGRHCSARCAAIGRWGNRSLDDKFWKCIIKDGPLPAHRPELGPCWIWIGSTLKDGRGTLSVDGKSVLAARFSFKLHNGKIDEDLNVCHHCDNPNCPNPSHLFQGTQRDNLQDAKQKGRVHLGEKRFGAKLRDADIVEIRRLYSSGEYLQKEIGGLFGVSEYYISAVVRRDKWAHLDG